MSIEIVVPTPSDTVQVPAALASHRGRAYDLIRRLNGAPTTTRALAAALGLSRSNLGLLLGAMVREGWLRKTAMRTGRGGGVTYEIAA